MTATAIAEERTAALAPLRPRPDQRERWHTFTDPVPFDVAAQRILDAHREDGERDDVVTTDLRSWAFGSQDGHTMQLVRIPFAGRDPGEPLPLRELAFYQLAQKIGAPAPYLRELPAKLQVACINFGLTQREGAALLRLAGGEVRAVLSDRYAAADDALLLDIVSDCLDRTGYRHDVMVRAAGVGPHTVLRLTLPGEGVPVKVDDVIEHGIDLGNSELGLRSVQVTPVTHRLICTNGMRAWRSQAAVRMRHIGDPERLRDQIADAIPVAFAEARGDLDKWKRAVDVLVDNALEEIESLRGVGLSGAEVRAVGQTLAEERHLLPASGAGQSVREALGVPTTAFEVANAITATARTKGTAARLGLEEVGHRYLTRRAA
jgi:hypothetical protein